MNGKGSSRKNAKRGSNARQPRSSAAASSPGTPSHTRPRAVRLLVLIAIIFTLSVTGSAEPVFPQPQGMLNDFAGKLSPGTKQQLETLLTNFKDRSGGIEVSVVTMDFDKLGGYPIEDYAIGLARRWGIGAGSEKNGLLLLIAIRPPDSQGRYSGATRLEVSRHLEGDMPDGLAGALVSRMRDDFRAGQFDRAITTGVQTILATLASRRGISMDGIDQSYAYQPGSETSRPPREPTLEELAPLIIFGGIMLLMAISALRKRRSGGAVQPGARTDSGTDCMPYPFIFGGGAGGFGGYRDGSGPYGSGGGSDGGFGGFGGGGDFGGGGATDNW